MTRILAVIGSPRRNGNTHILVSKIAEGARTKGAEVDKLFLGECAIAECDGCHACWQGKRCSKDDDMRGIYPRIVQSDAIIFGTPVYWYAPTGLMKLFMDRFVYFNCAENRDKIRGKAAIVAVVLEEDNPNAASLVMEFFEKSLDYLEMKLLSEIIVPGVSYKGQIREKPDRLRQAYELGQSLI